MKGLETKEEIISCICRKVRNNIEMHVKFVNQLLSDCKGGFAELNSDSRLNSFYNGNLTLTTGYLNSLTETLCDIEPARFRKYLFYNMADYLEDFETLKSDLENKSGRYGDFL